MMILLLILVLAYAATEGPDATSLDAISSPDVVTACEAVTSSDANSSIDLFNSPCVIVDSEVMISEEQHSVPETAEGGIPPDFQILKLSWSKGISLPPGWDRPVYSASNPNRDSRSASQSSRLGGRRRTYYIYSAKIRNSGKNVIKAMAWEYRVLDPESKKELGRHQFWTYTKIGLNKTVTLEGRSASPPSKVVSVAGLEKDKRSPYIEQAVIKCVIYADGMLWKNPATDEADCERLKRGRLRS